MRLLKRLYDRPVFKRELPVANAQEVVSRWESRRFFFNVAVGGTGIITCILLIVCAIVSEPLVGEAIGLPDGPLLGVFGIFFYAILVNLFYTSGWIIELALRTMTSSEKSSLIATLAFRAGVTFSVVLTFIPALFCWSAFGLALYHGQTHGPTPE